MRVHVSSNVGVFASTITRTYYLNWSNSWSAAHISYECTNTQMQRQTWIINMNRQSGRRTSSHSSVSFSRYAEYVDLLALVYVSYIRVNANAQQPHFRTEWQKTAHSVCVCMYITICVPAFAYNECARNVSIMWAHATQPEFVFERFANTAAIDAAMYGRMLGIYNVLLNTKNTKNVGGVRDSCAFMYTFMASINRSALICAFIGAILQHLFVFKSSNTRLYTR